MNRTKNDLAWQDILENVISLEEGIRKDGYFDIKSETIKEHREPRLACKIDYRQKTPKPLKDRGLSVLAIKNDRYRVARTDPFISVDQDRCQETEASMLFQLPPSIEVLTPQNISGECKALDAAFLSGMLDHVTGEELSLVLRGRESCKPIGFKLPDQINARAVPYEIESVQLEVDGGYEGEKGIHLFEAKVGLSNNMNLRQLLYPQLHYAKLHDKKLNTYVMFYEQGREYFHFLRFETEGQDHHFSGYECFALEAPDADCACCHFPLGDWNEITGPDKTDHGAPFPQADSIEKILGGFLKLAEVETLTKESMFSSYNFDARQHDYYSNVLRWMGLAEAMGRGREWRLTRRGKRISKLCRKGILWEMAKIIFSNDLCRLFMISDNPDIPEVIRRRNGLVNLANTHLVEEWEPSGDGEDISRIFSLSNSLRIALDGAKSHT